MDPQRPRGSRSNLNVFEIVATKVGPPQMSTGELPFKPSCRPRALEDMGDDQVPRRVVGASASAGSAALAGESALGAAAAAAAEKNWQSSP